MTANDLEELLAHGLKEMYYVETELLDVLDELADGTDTEEVADAFDQHREQTEGHVERLEDAFDQIGIEPETEQSPALDGLVEAHEQFESGDPDQDVLDVYNVAAAEKTEHLEIASYGNLAFLADELGMDEVADALGETLDEEKETLDELKDLTESFDYEQVPA